MYQIQKYKNFCIVLVSIIGILKNFSRTPHPRISYITRQILNHYELVLCLIDRSRVLDSAFNIQTLVSNLINMLLIDLRGYLKLVSLIKIISLCLAKDFIYIYIIFRRKRRLIESIILVKYNTSKFFGFRSSFFCFCLW